MKLNPTLLVLAVAACLSVGNERLQAHFLWLVPMDESGERVTLYFSEGPEPDNPALLERVVSASVVPYRTAKPEKTMGFTMEEDKTKLVAKHTGASAWTMTHTFGTHGRDEKNLLVYTASSVACRRLDMSEKDAISLPKKGYTAEPNYDGQTLTIQIWDDMKPASDLEVELQSANDQRSMKTDGQGKLVAADIHPGVYAIRLLKSDASPGEHQGVAFKATKHYTTISFIVPDLKNILKSDTNDLGVLPEAITSFGAASIGDTIYAYGGHTGGAHSYSMDEQFNKLICLDLKSRKSWEPIADGPKVQGNALVAAGTSLILVGGFSAQNAKGEKSRLVSQSLVQKYDLQEAKWIEMPSLPEPRSSMDATVHDGSLYAIGGWNMNGNPDETQWHTTAWRLPLGKDQEPWQPIAEPPFQRRAVAVVSHRDRVFVIGGMDSYGGPTTETMAYRPASNTWETVGSIVGVPMNGFGAAAAVWNGKLMVSTVDGALQELNDTTGTWSVVGHATTGRFFHRMLPVSPDSLAIFGGANMNVGKFRETDFFVAKPHSTK